jgi:hypothetical protein
MQDDSRPPYRNVRLASLLVLMGALLLPLAAWAQPTSSGAKPDHPCTCHCRGS